MKQVKNHLKFMGKLWMILGASFLAASVVFIILYFVLDYNEPRVFVTLAGVFGWLGITWFIIGLCFYMYAKRKDMRRERIKKEGMRYEAEIVRIIPNPYVRIGGYTTVCAECFYINGNGKKCLVKSDSFLQYNSNEVLKASVYVIRGNPRDYVVEINSGLEADVQFDYDYR